MADGTDAIRFMAGLNDIFQRIRSEDWEKIDEASSIMAEAVSSGHSVYCISDGPIPPLANSYGAAGNPNLFAPYDLLAGRLKFFPTVPMKDDVLLLIGQFDSSPFMDEIAARCKVLGAYTIFVGTPADRSLIPLTMPMSSLPQVCDLTIDSFTPSLEGLLKFSGIDVEACPTAGITGMMLFHVLNIEVAERISRGIESHALPSRTIKHVVDGNTETPLFIKRLEERN
jgi:uncharacterized phosphosugar-binding protein